MVVSLAWLVPAILGGVNVIAQNRLYHQGSLPWRAIIFDFGDWLLYALLTPGVFALSRRWPLQKPHLARRVVLHLALSLLFCAAWAGVGTLLRAIVQPRALDEGVIQSFVSWVFITFPFGVAVYLMVVGIEHATRYFVEVRDRELQVARLSEQLAGARFAALEARLNPHFLFNTLNTVTVLVREGDRPGATRMVEQLSDILRRTLRQDRRSEVALEEELELIQQYLAIEQQRFSDRLRTELSIDPATRTAALPSFALQHLVENAIRHGVARQTEAGRVGITARRDGDTLVLTVTDDGPGIDASSAEPAGHGLANTRERLKALYQDRTTLDVRRAPEGGTIATLRLPWHVPAPVSPGG
jgi:LytS/YehU family sensor histidine kinase